MTINVAIVEDSVDDLTRLTGFLQRYEKDNDIDFKIKSFADALTFLDEYTPSYDIIFMDIELGSENGMETARKLRAKDNDVFLIFETNIAKFALQGYEVDAVDYLLKPLTYPMLTLRLNKVIESIKNTKKGGEIEIKTSDGPRYIPLSKIKYIESQGHDIIFHMTYGEILGRDSLTSLEKRLPKDEFVRCNNCFLVNLAMIHGLDKNECLLADERLQISRPKKKHFYKMFYDYLMSGKKVL